ncbi:glycosyltransferase family 2 protein [Amycolatopsis lurida]
MPVISVITAVYNGGHHYLLEAYESLAKQTLPEGWEWQWCLQEDGDTGQPLAALPADSRISYGTGLHARTGVARTMALTRAQGSLVRTFDADDILLPGALQRDIDVLRNVAWCTSACIDLLPDGTTEPGPYDPPDGPIEPGRFFAEHSANRLSVQAVTFAAHTGLVWTLGGWPALTGAETDGLLLAADAVSAGWFIAEPSVLYRKHSAQTTASSRYWDDAESTARAAAVRQRADALRKAGWRWNPGAHQ